MTALPRPADEVDPNCPGCGNPRPVGLMDCDDCEYYNLLIGRSHYCGQASCYCRNLRGTMRRDVLNSFIKTEVTR